MTTTHREEVRKLIDEMTDEQLLDLKEKLSQLIQEKNLQSPHWTVKLYAALAPKHQDATEND